MPKKIRPRPLKHRDFLKRLKRFGIIAITSRGKGSEVMLIEEVGQGSKYQGEQFPIKDHGKGTEHSVRVIDRALSRFRIDPNDFWG